MTIAGGILGQIEPAATTYKSLYRPASGLRAAVTIAICNRAAATRTVRVALVATNSADPTPGDGTFLVYNTTLQASGDADNMDKITVDRVVLNGTTFDQIVIYASGVDVDFQCFGITEA